MLIWWDSIKKIFRKGGDLVQTMQMGQELKSISDHPRVAVDAEDLKRIDASFKHYSGEYSQVEYLNSLGVRKKRPYMYLNMTKEVAKYMSQIVFNEQCKVYIGDGDSEAKNDAQAYLEHVLSHNKFIENLSEHLEPLFATGGLACKPYYDAARGEIEYSWCLANAFYPLRNNSNDISECVIPNVTIDVQNKRTFYYTLLEFHEWKNGMYTITNELYKSERKDVIGKRVPLAELYEDLQDVVEFGWATRNNFSYIRPAGFNNKNVRSKLGIGLCENALTTLKQINDTYDAFHWEIKQGKRRVIVSDHFMTTRDERGEMRQVFDSETDIFVALPNGMDDMHHQDITSDIRSTQYIASIDKFIKTLEMQVGLSAGTFTLEGNGVRTATEVASENSTTYRTRNMQISQLESFIKSVILSTFELAKNTYDKNGKPLYSGEMPNAEDIGIDFDDGVFVDKTQQLEHLLKASVGGFIPKKEAMQRLFGLDNETADKWFDDILSERLREMGALTPDVSEEVGQEE